MGSRQRKSSDELIKSQKYNDFKINLLKVPLTTSTLEKKKWKSVEKSLLIFLFSQFLCWSLITKSRNKDKSLMESLILWSIAIINPLGSINKLKCLCLWMPISTSLFLYYTNLSEAWNFYLIYFLIIVRHMMRKFMLLPFLLFWSIILNFLFFLQYYCIVMHAEIIKDEWFIDDSLVVWFFIWVSWCKSIMFSFRSHINHFLLFIHPQRAIYPFILLPD